MRLSILSIAVFLLFQTPSFSQHSVARKWNEALLEGIRNDFARPTVHARNLFHTSIAMYDAWAAFDGSAQLYLLGQTNNGYSCRYNGILQPQNTKAAQEEAISYACYRLLTKRFEKSPKSLEIKTMLNGLMDDLGYDRAITTTNLEFGSPAALGNYIAKCIIEYGLIDGSNEQNDYENLHYSPLNNPLIPTQPGNPTVADPNRWQPLTLDIFIDQSGNIIPGATPEFLGPEWGNVFPFALTETDLNVYARDNNEYKVYHDPGNPPYLETDGSGLSDEYKWNFSLVSKWSSHLDPNDNVLWNISPGGSGNVGSVSNLPTELTDYRLFYNTLDGGDPGTGRSVNPKTGLPYADNIVPRGDYTRVLAEFWADGPTSETPPGHWFTILNYVNDHPLVVKKFKGEGSILSGLEWDVKAYFILGGAMHDAAVSAWGIKGWYDYIRPISAIRYMGDKGQSTDSTLSNFSPEGIPLENGLIEVVQSGDPLAGSINENVDKIKLWVWRGPDYINDPNIDLAGVGWILAENWWPYQRPSFVTPPFAGYISGHSTFSRAAAEVLTLLTGDEFFPGGIGEFIATKNEFLVFEEGPSVDVTLQWATYNDASDQTSLSRIWGGIHPPADDIRGRIIGAQIAIDAFSLAEKYFLNLVTSVDKNIDESNNVLVYPNPAKNQLTIELDGNMSTNVKLFDLQGRPLLLKENIMDNKIIINTNLFDEGVYILEIEGKDFKVTKRIVIVQ
jgi:hypothetical protein